MSKYMKLFVNGLIEKREAWLKLPEGAPNADVYRLVHSVKGTAGMLGAPEWAEPAEDILRGMEEESEKRWSAEQLEYLLAPLYALAENWLELEKKGGVPGDEAAPQDMQAEVTKQADQLVLLVDDDISLLQEIKDRLHEAGMQVLATPRAEHAVRLFFEMKPDCLVLDVRLEETTGFDVLADIRRQSAYSLVPTVMMSGHSDKATRIRCYASGADDFVQKPADPEELIVRIQRQLERRALVRRLLLTDELTGAYNVSYMQTALDRELADLAWEGRRFSIACLDIDRFRDVNEAHGHLEGDALLRGLADMIRDGLHRSVTLIRERTDRFFVIMPGVGAEEGAASVRRVIAQFAANEFRTRMGETYRATCSAGISEMSDPLADVRVCSANSVLALNEAKKEGGGRLVADRSAVSGEARMRHKRARIAIVDDDPLLRDMLEQQLRNIGGEETETDIRTFSDGEAFLSDPWHEAPGECVVVLDRMMPRANGMEVLRKLRGLPNSRSYYIMMLTGDDDERHVAEAIENGTDDYITKPFRMEELKSRIRRRLKGYTG